MGCPWLQVERGAWGQRAATCAGVESPGQRREDAGRDPAEAERQLGGGRVDAEHRRWLMMRRRLWSTQCSIVRNGPGSAVGAGSTERHVLLGDEARVAASKDARDSLLDVGLPLYMPGLQAAASQSRLLDNMII